MKKLALTMVLLLLAISANAQWQIQDAHIKADLRGVDSLGNGVAWASGSNGTVLRTEDGGYVWQLCAKPKGGETLDFRGVQAFDNNNAIVMSSGKGDLSRLYKTTDGCQTWKKVFDDPDENGFFDSLNRVTEKQLFLLGDPVGGKFAMYTSRDGGDTWYIADDPGLDAPKDAGAFAASNSALSHVGPYMIFGTGGPQAAVYVMRSRCDARSGACTSQWDATQTPIAHGAAAAGVFSVSGRFSADAAGHIHTLLVAVGGTYDKPDDVAATAAFSANNGETWTASATGPQGFRSAVAYDRSSSAFVAVGPNGTDISTDDGHTWHPLTPGKEDAPDADKHWNALSLPFVVGPKGRIGLLREDALRKTK